MVGTLVDTDYANYFARIMRMLKMMKEWGSGYQRIREACNADGYPEPEWQELGAAVRIVFRPHPETGNEVNSTRKCTTWCTWNLNSPDTDEPANEPVNDAVNKRQKWFLKQLASGKKINSADIVEQCHVAPVTAKRDIAELKHLGMIEFVGPSKTGYYRRK